MIDQPVANPVRESAEPGDVRSRGMCGSGTFEPQHPGFASCRQDERATEKADARIESGKHEAVIRPKRRIPDGPWMKSQLVSTTLRKRRPHHPRAKITGYCATSCAGMPHEPDREVNLPEGRNLREQLSLVRAGSVRQQPDPAGADGMRLTIL